MSTIAEKLALLLNTKRGIKAALVEKGQNVNDRISTYADKIRAIPTDVTARIDRTGNLTLKLTTQIASNGDYNYVVLIDRTVGERYELYVADGELMMALTTTGNGISNEDIILTDTSTGMKYELYVEDGKLSIAMCGDDNVIGVNTISIVDSATTKAYNIYITNGNLSMSESEG